MHLEPLVPQRYTDHTKKCVPVMEIYSDFLLHGIEPKRWQQLQTRATQVGSALATSWPGDLKIPLIFVDISLEAKKPTQCDSWDIGEPCFYPFVSALLASSLGRDRKDKIVQCPPTRLSTIKLQLTVFNKLPPTHTASTGHLS